ncbi:uncharacterized protein LOC119571159 [Penaeus monodon]|uniref:uncharacterized protein LOC119571159 n=1 Tax=Penaeus monodon TaxID=6687 RepID=UPI0018A78F53|nr:uncharacterized protein LOC119571159 [Penaeus monodon]
MGALEKELSVGFQIASFRPKLLPASHRLPEGLTPRFGDTAFVRDCLRAHNLYRARHEAPPLVLSNELCELAQSWANQLADLGENLFCRNTALILKGRTSVAPEMSGSVSGADLDVKGDEVAAHWYSTIRHYKFNIPDFLLQANQGPFTQMIWKDTENFGVGKARTRDGKIMVVAYYSPPAQVQIASFRPKLLPASHRLPEGLTPRWGDTAFVRDCLRAHNLYRARHEAPPLVLSNELCELAQSWANQLAHTGTFRHRSDPDLGENLFCRNTALILKGRTSVAPEMSGSVSRADLDVKGDPKWQPTGKKHN